MRLLTFFILFSLSLQAQKTLLAPSAAKDSISHLCRGKGSELYYAKADTGGILFFRSADKGQSWKTTFINLKEMNFKPVSQPVTLCDTGESATKDRIYVCWSDIKNGGTKNEDIFLCFSKDKGEYFADPVLVTYRPNHHRQFMPAAALDQKTGKLFIAYYDRQNYIEGKNCDLSLAVSPNGGLKFDICQIRKNLFEPVHPPILRTEQNKQSCCVNGKCTIVNDSLFLSCIQLNSANEIELEKTFAFNEEIKINFKTGGTLQISAELTKPLEPGYSKVIVKNKTFRAGENALTFKPGDLGIPKGNYVLTLYFNQKNTFCWIIEE